MAAESNTGFHRDETLSSALNRHAISFQSTATTSSSEMMTMGNYFGVNNASAIMFSGNSSVVNNNNNHPVISQATNSSGSLLLDTVPGLKHDAGLAVEWSVEEQFKLEEGLVMQVLSFYLLTYVPVGIFGFRIVEIYVKLSWRRIFSVIELSTSLFYIGSVMLYIEII